LYSDDMRFSEGNLFNNAPAWQEYDPVWDFRLRVENAIGSRLDGDHVNRTSSAALYADPVQDPSQLLQREPLQLNLQRVDPGSSGYFLRTISLLSSIEQGSLRINSGPELKNVLDQTMEVSLLLSLSELNSFLPSRASDRLYEYLRTALLMDAAPSKVTNHAFRRALQKILIEDYHSDIVAFARYLDEGSGHVADHLYHTCTDHFLTELYEVYEDADDVVEAHAQLLEWHGTARNDDDARLLARSYRLGLVLSKVRGSIEETRIYVDPLRFLQWLQAELGTDIRRLADDLPQVGDSDEKLGSAVDPVRALQEPRARLHQLFEKAYREFCTNRFNGIDSYGGRRIRHGTLYGRLIAELRPFIQEVVDEAEGRQPWTSEYMKSWFSSFEEAIKEVASELLHVRSKDKPRGVILPTLDDSTKLRSRDIALTEVMRAMRERRSVPVILALVHEHCWVIFEADLKRCREVMEEVRRRFVIRQADYKSAVGFEPDQWLNDRFRQINSQVLQQFEGVRAWLTRPSNISPTATIPLLFEAVLKEVENHHPAFQPKLNFQGATDVHLIGHRFHFFYDILYILVDNAARHGQPSGTLTLTTSSVHEDTTTLLLTVSIMSELNPNTSRNALQDIDRAMTADIGDAMVREGQSGLRKVRGLVEHVDEITSFTYEHIDQSVKFTMTIRLPRS
ncbi:hypothetical protein IQ250_25640, partial [Pseudanabaenaceae cyanobacterium LEGE 13415]|nr:hypothetical protein [Pseudanabaenaceae cyanobacterium LEGE 13415]